MLETDGPAEADDGTIVLAVVGINKMVEILVGPVEGVVGNTAGATDGDPTEVGPEDVLNDDVDVGAVD
jgi:hypothetical protein